MTAARASRLGAFVAAALSCLVGCGRLSTSPEAASSTSSSPSWLRPSPYPSSTRTGLPAVPPPAPAAVNGADVDAVALAAVRAVEGSDTALDADPHDTVLRASAWLTPAFAAQVRAYPPTAAPGATWNTWAAHRAYLVVSTSLGGDEHPADSARAAWRQVVAVLHPLGRDGWVGPDQTVVVFVTLAPAAGQWRLASIQTS